MPALVAVRFASPGVRATVISLAIAWLILLAVFAGRPLIRAWRSRPGSGS